MRYFIDIYEGSTQAMWKYFKNNIYMYIGTIFLGLLFSMASIYISFFLKKMMDLAIAQDVQKFKSMLVMGGVYLLFVSLIHFLWLLCSKKFLKKFIIQLRSDVFEKVISHPKYSFYGEDVSKNIALLTNDINILEENFIIPSIHLFQQVTLFLCSLVALFYLNIKITCFLILFMILAGIIPKILSKQLEKKQLQFSEQYTHFVKFLKEYLDGSAVIFMCDAITFAARKFKDKNIELGNKKYFRDKIFIINDSLSFFLSFISQLAILLFGTYLILKGEISPGVLVAIIQLSGSFINPISVIIDCQSKIYSTKPIIQRINSLETYQKVYTENIVQFDKGISMKNIKFKYDKETSFSLMIEKLYLKKGRKYLVLGKSGSGKSTFVKLLINALEEFEGEVKIDEVDTHRIDAFSLNQIFGVMSQKVFLFDSSVLENICFSKEYGESEVSLILEKSGVNEFAKKLKDGIHTRVGDAGNNLSGGQAQRIALARTLIGRKPVLVLDEATSSVDIKTGMFIEECLLEEKELTLITITHKINEELLNLYDSIIIMKDGRIVANLCPDEVKKNDFFKELFI